MKNTKIMMLTAILAVLPAAGAYAEGENVVSSKAYVDASVATKQAALAGSGANVAVTFPATAGGTPNSRTIGTTVTTGDNLVTTGGVNTALNEKQQKINGTADTVVTYTGTAGGTGQKAVYNSSGAYAAGALAEAQHVNDTVIEGFNSHLTCANPNDGCTLWQMNTLTGTIVPHGN